MIYQEAIELLQQLIATPSVSRSEEATADILQGWLEAHGIKVNRYKNNVWAVCKDFDPSRPTLLLNSHHDTVKPSPSYTFDPFKPFIADGKLYGLGSNDAGASVVSLATAFVNFQQTSHRSLATPSQGQAPSPGPLPFNLVLAITAEEEVMGENGMRAMLPHLKEQGIRIDMALVGEPTQMQPAVAERGLVVLDCEAHGVTGHAARNEGVNALYIAIDDIKRLREYQFPKVSETLGPIKISVTQIEAGRQHNVVPELCRFVADVRTTDAYTNEETAEIIASIVKSDVKARSYRVRASVIDRDHPLVATSVALGGVPYVSPTTSDMALMHDFPSLKMGPGDSARSHSADEYICLDEIRQGIDFYIRYLSSLSFNKNQ